MKRSIRFSISLATFSRGRIWRAAVAYDNIDFQRSSPIVRISMLLPAHWPLSPEYGAQRATSLPGKC